MKKLFAVLFLAVFLGACAHMGERGPVYRPSDTVLFDGLEFKVNSLEYRYAPLASQGKQAAPQGVFVMIDLTMKNTYSSPVPPQFQPRFTLVDSKGGVHAPSRELSEPKAENGFVAAMSPGVGQAKRLVFDVPPGSYRLRAFMPVVVKSVADGEAMQGRVFFYEMGSVR